MIRRASVISLLAVVAMGCAVSPFKRAGNAGDVAAALGRGQAPPAKPANAAGQNLVFLVLEGTGGPRLAAYDLGAAKLLWTQAAEVTTRVAVAGGVLVHGSKPAAGDKSSAILTGRDVTGGAPLWQYVVPPAEKLYGYDIEGGSVYLVVQGSSGRASATSGDVVALDAKTGTIRWRHVLPPGRVGAPAVRGGLIAVPVQSQYVVLLEATAGLEVAQVLSTEEAASFVRSLPEGMFYGSYGLFLLAPSTARGSRQAPGYLRAHLPAFVRPIYWYDHYRPEQAVYSAVDRNRVLWRVSVEGESARFRDDMAFVHHYRFFFGFDAASGTLKWAYNHPVSDAVASAHTGRAIVFVTRDGEMGALDTASGTRTFAAKLAGDDVVRGATFDAEGFTPAGAGTPPELLPTLASIVGDPDQRFPELKAFAIAELGRLPGRSATSELLDILKKGGLPAIAYQKAAEALVGRRDAESTDMLAAALKLHADYAEGRPAPPVELLARAAGALGSAGRAVVPELVAHLRRPETPAAAAAEIARALAAIGPEAAETSIPALRDFLTMYRADPIYEADPKPLVALAEALLKIGGAADRELLLFVAEEPRSVSGLRAHLQRALGETAPRAPAPRAAGLP
jgi:outer membrane protein assembly factor BamB